MLKTTKLGDSDARRCITLGKPVFTSVFHLNLSCFGENDPEGAISISTEDRLADISKEKEFKRGVASYLKAQTLNTKPVRE